MMRQKRDEAFRLKMSESEKLALQLLAEKQGSSQAAVLRGLVRGAAERAHIWYDRVESANYRGRGRESFGPQAEL